MANSMYFDFVCLQVENMEACYHWAMESVTGIKITIALLVEAEACIYFNERVTHSGKSQ